MRTQENENKINKPGCKGTKYGRSHISGGKGLLPLHSYTPNTYHTRNCVALRVSNLQTFWSGTFTLFVIAKLET